MWFLPHLTLDTVPVTIFNNQSTLLLNINMKMKWILLINNDCKKYFIIQNKKLNTNRIIDNKFEIAIVNMLTIPHYFECNTIGTLRKY